MVFNMLAVARRNGKIQGKEMAPLLAQWKSIVGANPENQLAVYDPSSIASKERDNFITSLGYATEFGVSTGENRIRTSLAIDTYNMEYLKASSALKAELGRVLEPLEQMRVAQEVRQRIYPTLVELETLASAEGLLEENQVVIQETERQEREDAATRVLLVQQATAQGLTPEERALMSNDDLSLALE